MILFGKKESNKKSTKVSSIERLIYINLIILFISIILTYFLSMINIVKND